MENFPVDKIITSFEGNLSAEDTAGLEIWLAESEHNRQQYNELKKVYFAGDKIKSNFNPDNSAALKKVHQHIAFKETIRWTRRIAAALIIIFLSGQLWYRINPVTGSWHLMTAQNKQVLYLPDSTKVILAPEASIQYPDKFNHKTRKVILDGKAYFEVTHDKKHPFIVQTQQTEVQVLGTRFLVDASSLKNQITVDEGKVSFQPLKNTNQSRLFLTKNEQGTWDENSNQLIKQIHKRANSNSWLSGRLTFSDTPLVNVVKDIEALYNIKIEINEMLSPKLQYTGNFNNTTPDKILNIIVLSLNLQVKKQDNKYILLP